MSAPHFLVDENLSVVLPTAAHEAGFAATHVVHLGLGSEKDWALLDVVLDGDWVLVTSNAMEFRRRYRGIELHAGIVFIMPSVPRKQQLELFRAALDDIAADPDLINKAVDVDYDPSGRIRLRRYELP